MDVDDRSESENSRKPVEPISLEDLLKQKQEEEAQEAKVRGLFCYLLRDINGFVARLFDETTTS
jgi:hypothetical protein